MVLTLLISTVLYVLVAAIAVSAVSSERLASSAAPLSLVFREVAGVSPATISAIAIVATLNTILAQLTMAARVIYGLARAGSLPSVLAQVHPRTRTPLAATALVVHRDRSTGVAGAVDAAGGADVAGDTCRLCGRQSCPAAVSQPWRGSAGSSCHRADLGARDRIRDLRCHDRAGAAAVSLKPLSAARETVLKHDCRLRG